MSADWPLARVTNRDALGPPGETISRNNGESREVQRLARHPGWLLKLYRPGAHSAVADQTLDRLIRLPKGMSPTDSATIRDGTAWPVSRVVDADQRTVGVVFREAPAWYRARLRLGRDTVTESVLQVDWLCKPADACHRRGLPFLEFYQRLDVCRSLASIAEVLERHSVVYGDWSYRNAFWSVTDRSGFLIDLDSCGFGFRPAVQSPAWQDPLLHNGRGADVTTDRYGVALLVARCLTAERDRRAVLPALEATTARAGRADIYRLVRQSLAASKPDDRPTIRQLLDQLGLMPFADMAMAAPPLLPNGANVAIWFDVRAATYTRGGGPQPPPQSAQPVPLRHMAQHFHGTAPVRPPFPGPPTTWREDLVDAILGHLFVTLLVAVAFGTLLVLIGLLVL